MTRRNLSYLSYIELHNEIMERCSQKDISVTESEIDETLFILEVYPLDKYCYINVPLFISYIEELGVNVTQRKAMIRIAEDIFRETGYEQGLYTDTGGIDF